MKSLIPLLIALSSLPLYAASPYKQSLDKKLNQYLSDGVFVGGKAGQSFSLINVRRDISKTMQMERVILDLGDQDGKPLYGKASYFQAHVQQNPPRIIIDLAQLSKSAISESKMKEIFKKSPFIKSVELTSDPEDRAATLVLNLNTPMKAEVFEMPAKDKPSRIVVDIKKMN